MVREHAVDFFQHGPGVLSDARLDVNDGNGQFRGGQGASQGGVGVAVNQQGVGPLLLENVLHGHEGGGGHGRVGAGPDAEVMSGRRDAEFLEKHVGHVHVVVLAGVHENMLPGTFGAGGGD